MPRNAPGRNAAEVYLLEEVGGLHVDAHSSKNNGKFLVLLLLISLHICPLRPIYAAANSGCGQVRVVRYQLKHVFPYSTA